MILWVNVAILVGMLLETAHLASPIALAWHKPELRAVVSREWIKYIAIPAAILPACVLVPSGWVFGLYYAWNIHHFGMQNFGVWQLFGRKVSPDGRLRRALICLAATAFGMAAVPILWPNIYGFALGTVAFSLNHWLVDIWLSGRAAPKRWAFVGVIFVVAIVYTVARQGPLSVHVLPQILVLRCGIGAIHFIYSARIWRQPTPATPRAMVIKNVRSSNRDSAKIPASV
jgi:hypothetical protein